VKRVSLRKIEMTELENGFKLIGKDWMLVTAGNQEKYNMMTASWGGLGIMWHKDTCFIVVRPQRYTREFIEQQDTFTLSFFPEQYRKNLTLLGTKSGREIDKMKESGLTAAFTEQGNVYFEEARIILECKKTYYQDIDPNNFLDPSIEKNYPNKDYHRMYFAEIMNGYMNE
jgi:flavin reductase (DIM6/NTAB) family NADH-FMN oxidoreductase RutF